MGNLYRKVGIYTTSPIEVLDHDFPSLATGVAIGHGLYDLNDNIGFISCPLDY
ncbi:MAG: ISAzo13 family transposase, partial [Nostoc sp. NOS(2021)]|nr:ISAzo13 family transposase [Nostoc sp. NOS(2021)]